MSAENAPSLLTSFPAYTWAAQGLPPGGWRC